MTRTSLTAEEEEFLATLRAMLLARPRSAAAAGREQMRRLARFAEAFLNAPQSLMSMVGTVCRTGAVCSWLGVSRQAVSKAVKTGRLLAFRTLDNRWLYPTWQFSSPIVYARSVEMLPPTLDILASRGLTGLPAAVWFMEGNKTLDSKTSPRPEAWIRNGQEMAKLLRAAKAAKAPAEMPTPRLADVQVSEI